MQSNDVVNKANMATNVEELMHDRQNGDERK